jgi:putative ATPase
VHRFNKAQQDAFLPFVEQGLVTFIGATTENPSFEVNGALLSRAAVYVLNRFPRTSCASCSSARSGSALRRPAFDDDALAALIGYATATAGACLNLLEQLRTAASEARKSTVDLALVENAVTRSLRMFDKGGESFYDQISALHKAVRGSDPDAALYWLCRMLDGGCDPLYAGRRMIRMASEDIGLADPRAMASLALDAVAAFERPRHARGRAGARRVPACISRAQRKAMRSTRRNNTARAFIAEDGSRPVPLRLRNAPTKLMKTLGYGDGYRYAHDEDEAYAAGETYLPDGMKPVAFYSRSIAGSSEDPREDWRTCDSWTRRRQESPSSRCGTGAAAAGRANIHHEHPRTPVTLTPPGVAAAGSLSVALAVRVPPARREKLTSLSQ